MAHDGVLLFALEASRDYGERVARHLGVALAEHEERAFEDGEHKGRPLVNVRGRDAFVVQSLYGGPQQSVNEKLVRLLFFIGALRDASAARITAVVPYLCYGRKDRKTQPRDPVTTRYLAALFEAVGTDRVVTIDAHNLAAFQNAFRCRTEHLEARGLFVRHFAPLVAGEHGEDGGDREEEVVVLSPDVGGMKRAELFRAELERALGGGRAVAAGFMEKRRALGRVSGETLFAEVRDRTVIIVDDLISTGTTMARAARACRERGARRVYAAATHGLFNGAANEAVAGPDFERVVVCDTVPPFRLDPAVVRDRLVVLDAARLFAAAIRAIHEGGSIVELLDG